jgi:hypothetical protein
MKRDADRERTLRQRKPSARRIEGLIAGHVASGNIDSDLRELALLSLECEMLRERLVYKTSCLGVAFNSINDHADHAWSLDVTLKLEPKGGDSIC